MMVIKMVMSLGDLSIPLDILNFTHFHISVKLGVISGTIFSANDSHHWAQITIYIHPLLLPLLNSQFKIPFSLVSNMKASIMIHDARWHDPVSVSAS